MWKRSENVYPQVLQCQEPDLLVVLGEQLAKIPPAPVGARIVAETLIGLIELDTHSYLSVNRNWEPADGVGVATLGEMMTYAP